MMASGPLALVSAAGAISVAIFWVECLLIATGAIAILMLPLLGLAIALARFCYDLFQIRYACPNQHCGIPLFLCPRCGGEISDLRPSLSHGIWFHRCGRCGTAVPTLDWIGRRELKKRCATKGCGLDLTNPGLGRQSEFHFAVWGDVSSGKTNLIVAAVWMLSEWAERIGWNLAFSDLDEQRRYASAVAQLREGQPLPKTGPSIRTPTSFTVALEPPTSREPGCVLYLYDAAGDDLRDPNRLHGHLAHQSLHGVLFVVDPFAERAADRVFGELDPALHERISPAERPAAEMLNNLVARLDRARPRGIDGRFPISLAVAVTKIFALPDAHALPPAADPGLMGRYDVEAAAQHSQRVRRFLEELDLTPLIETARESFESVAFFSSSAFDRCPHSADRSPSRPVGTLAPLAWLISSAHAIGHSRRRQLTTAVIRRLSGRAGRTAQIVSILAIMSVLVAIPGTALLAVLVGLDRLTLGGLAVAILIGSVTVFGVSYLETQIYINWHLADGPLKRRVIYHAYNLLRATMAVGLTRLFTEIPGMIYLSLNGMMLVTGGLPLVASLLLRETVETARAENHPD